MDYVRAIIGLDLFMPDFQFYVVDSSWYIRYHLSVQINIIAFIFSKGVAIKLVSPTLFRKRFNYLVQLTHLRLSLTLNSWKWMTIALIKLIVLVVISKLSKSLDGFGFSQHGMTFNLHYDVPLANRIDQASLLSLSAYLIGKRSYLPLLAS